MNIISKLAVALVGSLVSFCSNAYTTLPQDGLWGINQEQSLAVGRAFALETAGSTMIITFYNYNAVGAPTFYVGGGPLNANNTATIALSEPQGGTCLGCAMTSGRLLSSPGNVLFEFTSSTTGFVTLPREGRKAIIKGNFGFAAAPSGLLGGWAFSYLTGPTTLALADYALLTNIGTGTATGSGLAYNAAVTVACEQQVSGTLAGYVLCIRLLSTGTTDKQMLIKWYGNHMDGIWQYASSTIGNVFTARRILLGADQYTVKREAVPISPDAFAALRDAMEAAIARTPRPPD